MKRYITVICCWFLFGLAGASSAQAVTRFAAVGGSVNAFCIESVPCEIVPAIEQTQAG